MMGSRRSQEISDLRTAARKGRLLLAGAIVFSVFVNVLMLTGPLFMLQVYDRVLGSKSEETLLALFILVAVLYFLMALLDFARGRVLARIGSRIQRSVESRVLTIAIRRANGPRSDAALRSSLRDLDAVQSFYASPALQAVLDLPFTPIFFIAIFVFHPMLGWLGLAGGAVLVVLALANQIITTRMVRRAQLNSEVAHAFASEAISGSETVRSQGMLENVLARWKSQQAKALKDSMFATDWTGSFLSFTKATRLFLQSAMLGAGAYLVLHNEITSGGMIAGTILLGRALAPVEQLIGQWNVVQRFRHAWSSLNKMLGETPVEQPKTKLPVPASIMQVTNLTLVPPGGDKPTLRNVSFRLEPGQALGVIGRSGSGKSTLARAIVGLWPPAAGEIRLGGATLDQYDAEILGQRIGYLPQSVKLFPGTVADNIARMSTEPSAEAVVAAAQQANAHDMIMQLSKGYDTQVGEGFTQLSGGQMQRIALARALYCDPVLLILDEPNSALDAEGSDALNTAIRAFKDSERSVVIMTHRPTAISECDQLMLIEAGVTTDYGPRDDVLGRRVKNASNIRNFIDKAKTE